MSRRPLRFHALIFRENLRVGPHSSAFWNAINATLVANLVSLPRAAAIDD